MNQKIKDFIDGGNWVKKRMYSEEDLLKAFQAGERHNFFPFSCPDFKEWFEQFKNR